MKKTARKPLTRLLSLLIAFTLLAGFFFAPPPAAAQPPEPEDGALFWSLAFELPLPAAEAQALGGVNRAAGRLEARLAEKLRNTPADISVEPAAVAAQRVNYLAEIQARTPLEELRQVLYVDLDPEFDWLGGVAQVSVSGYVSAGETLVLQLDSRPASGYTWRLAGYDPSLVVPLGEIESQQKGDALGAPLQQTLRLQALAGGWAQIDLVYQRPFEPQAEVTRSLSLQADTLPGQIDLSSPIEALTAEPYALEGDEVAPLTDTPLVGLPASFDWRAYGGVPPVRDQGGCGSCWAFGSAGVMESALMLQGVPETDLSEQYLISCNRENWGCSGGWFAHDYHINKTDKLNNPVGAASETNMPYTAANGSCSQISKLPNRLANWHYPTGNWWTTPSVDQIKQAIFHYGPVATTVCAQSGFGNYRGGVFSTNESCGSSQVNHAVILDGWDDSSQTWILRNSWGSWWGEQGYMRIKWGTSGVGYATHYVVYQPNNDHFDSPLVLYGNQRSHTQSATSATTASDDPSYPDLGKLHNTVWFKFTPAQSGMIEINTEGSNYDTVVGVFTGARGALKLVAWNNDAPSGYNAPSGSGHSQVFASAAAGTPLYIQVAGRSSGGGDLKLNFRHGVNCYPLEVSAQPEYGEITLSAAPNCSEGKYIENTTQQLTAKAKLGYQFSGWQGSLSGSANPAELVMSQAHSVSAHFEAVPAAINDDFDNAILVSPPGGVFDWSDQRTISSATLATDDPFFPFRSAPHQGSQTVWYRFKPHVRGSLIVDTYGSTYDTILGIYRGGRGSLTLAAWNDNASRRLQSYRRINVLAGETYSIVVASKQPVNGELNIRFRYTPRSENNHSIRRATLIRDQGLGMITFSRPQDVYRATSASTDPLYPLESGASTGFRTVWYRFMPLHNGALRINTSGSNYDTLLGVFYGSWSAPVLHAWDDNSGGEGASQLETRLAGRTTYWIGVASREESPQGSNLNFNFEFTPEEAVGAGSYPASHPAFARLGNWESLDEGAKIRSSTPGNLTSLTFTSDLTSQVTVHFDRLETGGVLRVLLNGRRVGNINQAALVAQTDQVWSSRSLRPGRYTLTLLHHSGAAVSLNGVTVTQLAE